MKLKILKEGEMITEAKELRKAKELIHKQINETGNLENYLSNNLNHTREGKFMFDRLEEMSHELFKVYEILATSLYGSSNY